MTSAGGIIFNQWTFELNEDKSERLMDRDPLSLAFLIAKKGYNIILSTLNSQRNDKSLQKRVHVLSLMLKYDQN